MSVIAFHSGISVLSGGYIGVDVFFVISGYLITTLIYKEMSSGSFSFVRFYKRRAARLLPALSITLMIVLLFGFVFYNNKTFDNLGKELFFSSFGAANILFAQGINYFAKDEAYQPLIHLWSLGVEEQFYLVWPILLLFAYRLSARIVIPVAIILFIFSLALSMVAVEQGLTKGYFLLHYRAFELLVGVILALVLQQHGSINASDIIKQMVSFLGIILIIVPMFLLDEQSNFPGLNALWPCLGTALVIAFPNNGIITKLLAHKSMVFVGLISYPLYLYHQPVISFLYFFETQLSPTTTFLLVTTLTMFASWLTFQFVETPIRTLAHSPKKLKSNLMLVSLCATIPAFAVIGIGIAKTNGLEQRFKYLNPFALEISQAHATTFYKNFDRGYKVSATEHGKALFVGDSVLQHYILPMKLALDFDDSEIDMVTRGGCVLLKGVDFIDKFSDISCNDIRDKLYSNNKSYDYVVLSQAWTSYDDAVLNFSPSNNNFERWQTSLSATVAHFLTLADNVIIIGAHPSVDGTLQLQPSVTISKDSFSSNLNKLNINNIDELKKAKTFFNQYKANKDVQIIEPYKIFCEIKCVTSNDWSYFSDGQHVSNAATDFIKNRITVLMTTETLTLQQ